MPPFTPTPYTGPPIPALVLGGTGAVGKAVVRELLKSGHFRPVTVVGRRPVAYDGPNKENLVQHTVDYDNLEASTEVLQGHDVVFCSLGSSKREAGSAERFVEIDQSYVLAAAKIAKATAKHFIYVSSMGASASSYFLYPRTKGETEEQLKALAFPHLTILHPAFLKTEGAREKPRTFESLFSYAVPVLDRIVGESRISAPVSAVARAMLRSAEAFAQGNLKTPVTILTNGEILQISKDE